MTSLRLRLTLWTALAVTATGGAAAWLGHTLLQRQMLDGLDFLLTAESREVEERLDPGTANRDTYDVTAALAAHTEIDAPQYYFQVSRIGHGVVFRSRNLGPHVLPVPGPEAPGASSVELDGDPVRLLSAKHEDFLIQVATPTVQAHALLHRYTRSAWLGMPVLLVAGLLVGWLLASTALRPIRGMQRSAQRISATNLSERLPVPPGRDEIAALARLLNELFARLEASFDQIRRFTADASHELKTPLSLIRLHAERIAKSSTLGDEERGEIESQLEEIARLNKLVESLLLLAKADAGSLRIDRKFGDPAAFVSGFAEDASVLAEDMGRTFSVGVNDRGEIAFDASLLRQVLLNILSNALRHTPHNGRVFLESRMVEGHWEVAIEDNGPGLPAEHLERVFERFVRGPGADARAPDGSGLGLAIARSIIEAHGGTITAGNVPTGGLRVVVSIPGGSGS